MKSTFCVYNTWLVIWPTGNGSPCSNAVLLCFLACSHTTGIILFKFLALHQLDRFTQSWVSDQVTAGITPKCATLGFQPSCRFRLVISFVGVFSCLLLCDITKRKPSSFINTSTTSSWGKLSWGTWNTHVCLIEMYFLWFPYLWH